MAVRFSADGQDYTRALGFGSITAVSVACWAKLSVDRNAFSTVWSIDSGSTSDVIGLQTGPDGVSLIAVSELGNFSLRTLSVGVWYFLGASIDASGVVFVSRAATDTAFTLHSGSPGGNYAAVNAATLRIGESPWAAEWWNGCVTGLRWWNAKLTQQELENECWQHMPHRIANLQGWYPLLSPETVDYSGNGQTLSGGTGATVEDGPPISWGPARRRIWISSGPPAAEATGTASAALGSTATAGKVAPVTARASLAAVGQAAARKAGPAVGRAPIAATGAGTAHKTTPATGVGALAPASRSVMLKASPAAGRSPLAATAVSAATKVLLAAGRTPFAAASVAAAFKSAPATGVAPVLGWTRAAFFPVAAVTGLIGLASAGSAAAVKVVSWTSTTALVATPSAFAAKGVAAAGLTVVIVAGERAAADQRPVTALTSLALAGHAATAKRAAAACMVPVAVVGTATAQHLAQLGGTSLLTITALHGKPRVSRGVMAPRQRPAAAATAASRGAPTTTAGDRTGPSMGGGS